MTDVPAPLAADHRSPAISQGVLLALLADARLPTGAHTQSAGLEPGLRAGLRPEEVPAYISARLRTVVRVEAATAVVARHVALRALVGDAPPGGAEPGEAVPGGHADPAAGAGPVAAALALEAVRREWAARTPSAAVRRSSEQLGRGYARLVRRLWAGHPAVVALDAVRTAPRTATPVAGTASERARGGPPRPLVLGVTAVCAGLDPVGVARLVALDDVQTVASAFLKLAPVDPLVTAGWVLAAAPSVDALAHDVAHLTDAADLPATAAPLTEEWAETHARATERLFRA